MIKEERNIYMKAYSAKPENNVKKRIYMKKYYAKPEVMADHKAKAKIYNATPEGKIIFKESSKKYRTKPENKIKIKLHTKIKNMTPEGKLYNKIQNLKKHFNLTLEQYNEMLTLQVSGCTICGKTIQENGKALAVDHDHKTGQIRELLCHSCNVALGEMNDSPELLRKAADYLEKHKNNIKNLN